MPLPETVATMLSRLRLTDAERRMRTEFCLAVLGELNDREDIPCMMWGGSIGMERGERHSDVDIFCSIVAYSSLKQNALMEDWRRMPFVGRVVYQGYWPWFGYLTTLLARDDDAFALDVGLVPHAHATGFFWEPTGTILKDSGGVVAQAVALSIADGDLNRFGPQQPFGNLLLLLRKIRKNLERGHFWNVSEYVGQARRFLMFLLRQYHVPDESYLGRPDRDIESRLPRHVLSRLAGTAAALGRIELAQASCIIAQWSLELGSTLPVDLDSDLRGEIEEMIAMLARDAAS